MNIQQIDFYEVWLIAAIFIALQCEWTRLTIRLFVQ